jgi:uncharacterized damage-inducible protein DinB
MNLDLVEVLRYNAWANRTLLEACREFDRGAAGCPSAGGFRIRRELLVHIVAAQQTSVLRTGGRQHEGELNRASPWPGMRALVDIVERTNQELIAIAEQLASVGVATSDLDAWEYGQTAGYGAEVDSGERTPGKRPVID